MSRWLGEKPGSVGFNPSHLSLVEISVFGEVLYNDYDVYPSLKELLSHIEECPLPPEGSSSEELIRWEPSDL